MKETNQAVDVIQQLIQWAKHQTSVRAMLLTGSRANSNTQADVFSDYDVILVVPDIHPFFEDRSWLQDFGEVLVSYWDPIHPEPDFGIEIFSSVNQYANGLDIDFSIGVQNVRPGRPPIARGIEGHVCMHHPSPKKDQQPAMLAVNEIQVPRAERYTIDTCGIDYPIGPRSTAIIGIPHQ